MHVVSFCCSQLEFNYAARRKTAKLIIPVVMEEGVRDPSKWTGEVGLVLGGRLYVDMCGDLLGNEQYLARCGRDLYDKIVKLIKMPIKGCATCELIYTTVQG